MSFTLRMMRDLAPCLQAQVWSHEKLGRALLGAPRQRGPVDVEARLWTRVFGELLLCVAHDLGSVAELDQVITEVQGLDGGVCARLATVRSASLLRALQAQEARLGGRFAPTEALVEKVISVVTSAP